jgi:hypothetical protein
MYNGMLCSNESEAQLHTTKMDGSHKHNRMKAEARHDKNMDVTSFYYSMFKNK